MASSKIEDTGYTIVQLKFNRKKAKSVFNDLKEIATSYEIGVDEAREFYYRANSTGITERYWVGKGVKFFEPKREVEPIVNSYDVLVGQMTSGDNYLLNVCSTGSSDLYGVRKDNLILSEAILGFGSELATGITPTTNPVAGTPANMTDGNTATEWDSGTNQTTAHYIDIDLGAVKSYIGKVRLDSSSATDKSTTFADRFKVLISATGSFSGEETEAYASSADLGTADAVVTFVPTAGRYVRIQITQNKAAHWHVDLVEIYEWNVADITRWATGELNEKKDPIRRGVLELDSCTKRIWPRGKIRVTSRDGVSYYDYPHVATSVHVGANLKLQAKLELGKMAPSLGDEVLANRRMLAEYSIAGLSRDSDLASGSAIEGGKITHTHIGKDSIETPMLKALSIIAAKIAAGTITANEIATNTITANEIAANAVDTSELNADSVTAAKIDAGAVDTEHLAADSITTDKIDAGAVDTTELAAGAVEAAKINVSDLVNIANLLTVASGKIVIGANTLGAGLDGILVHDGTRNRVAMGEVSSNVYGFSTWDASGVQWLKLGQSQNIWQKIYDASVSGSAVTSINISGLNGNNDQVYFIVWTVKKATTAAATGFNLQFNGDTGNNYGRTYIGTDGTDVDVSKQTGVANWILTSIGPINAVGQAYMVIDAKTGKVRTGLITDLIEAAGTAILRVYQFAQVWSNTGSNITSMLFFADQAGAIGVGSHLVVYKMPVFT